MNKDIKSLYIHIPFCNKICDYCDFVKLQYFRNFAVSYLDALKEELASYNIGQLKTIYVGGGTPTALDDDLFLKLLQIIDPYKEGIIEYTFEANPESLSLNKIKMLKEHGVNRISIGVQTTDDKILKAVNRDHTFRQVQEAIHNLKEVGIDNINVDLILGLPHASKKILEKDLKNVLSLDVKHISCYGLTVNPHTALFNRGYQEPQSDVLRDFYDVVEQTLKKENFVHYEVSNWAKLGFESKHNLTYWRNEEYYGVGLGASGYIGETRYKNTINLSQYLKRAFVFEKENVSSRDKLVYQIMLTLRTLEGLDLDLIKNEYNIDLFKEKQNEIDKLINQKLLVRQNKRLIPTYEGMMILDQLILELISE